MLIKANGMRHNTDHHMEASPASDVIHCPLVWEMKPDMHEIAAGTKQDSEKHETT